MKKASTSKSLETDWERVDASSDDEIDYSEIPELGEAFFATAILEHGATPPLRYGRSLPSALPWVSVM